MEKITKRMEKLRIDKVKLSRQAGLQMMLK
jgi:hypothetical protein